MSADNAIYITECPAGFYVTEGSVTVMDELVDEHWFTPIQYAHATKSFFQNADHFYSDMQALNVAIQLANRNETEYGVLRSTLRFNPGDLPDKLLEKPKPPEGSCPHCSTGGSYTFHGEGGRYDTQCRNPDSIYNVIRLALQKETTGLNVALVTRIVVEALKEADE